MGYNFSMLRRILAWKYIIAVAMIFGFSLHVSHEDQKTRDQYEQKCTQLNPGVATPSPHSEDCDKGAENAARHLPRWYRMFGWPEGITTWAILLTLLAIAEQTEATRKSAEAALDQITMMKTKEQADMVVAFRDDTFFHPTLWEVRGLHASTVNFEVLVRNDGMTRAKNVAFYGAVSVTPTKEFPPMSDARRVIPFDDMFKAESEIVSVGIKTGNPFPVVADGARIRSEELFLHLYGFIAFTDAFGDRKISPFRWLWKSEQSSLEGIGGPPSGWLDVAWVGDTKIKEPYYYERKAN